MMQRKFAGVARGLKQLDTKGLQRVRDHMGEFIKSGAIFFKGLG